MSFGDVVGAVPEATGFKKRVGNPHVAVGGIVGVKNRPERPFVRGAAAPEPGGLMLRQVACGEVIFRPRENRFKGRFVAGDERKKERVGFALRRGDEAAVRRINDAARLHRYGFEGVPVGPIGGGDGAGERQKRGKCNHCFFH